ncbi:roadblock/LC7 domain-containing protein [Candidatus Alkanophaga liquidiphilum]|nr:putative regulator of Ras-like GTPase [Candidatus Alkanophaga liquidiphilum]
MPIDRILSDMLRRIDGAIAIGIIGYDGIIVEHVTNDPSFNPEVAAAEANTSLITAKKTMENFGGGNVIDILITAERVMFYLRPLNKDYWLGVSLDPNKANLGKLRLEVKKAVPMLQREIS